MYILVAIVIIESFIYFYANLYCEDTLVSLGFLNPVMLVFETYFTYSRFVVEKFTVKKKKRKRKKMYCFYRINLLECVLGVRFEVVNH